MNFLKSVGLKRYIASLLATVVEVLRVIPGSQEVISGIELAAGLIGITGIAHASSAKTLSKKKLLTASSLISFLIILVPYFPEAAPLLPLLQKAAALVGALGVGASIKKS